MAELLNASGSGSWLESSGLKHIFRSLGFAVQPAKLGVALCGIISTFALGVVLDGVWKTRGGVEETAIARFISSRELDQPHQDAAGDFGVFSVWREHERRCVLGLLGSSIPGASVAAGTPVGTFVESHSFSGPLRNLSGMGQGVLWMMLEHPIYFVIFAVGTLTIWSFCGGAICRMSAVQMARDEKLTARQGLSFSWDRLFDGFFLAPCIPVIFALIVMLLMALGGVMLRLPVIGDLIGGPLFLLAILGGFIVAVLLIGLFVGGSLFWPAVATEGSDAFDAFSRGLSYPLSRPWRALGYGVVAVIYAAVCWMFVNLFVYFALTVTRGVVAFGTSPFGWWARGDGDRRTDKLSLLWPLGGPNDLYSWPKWSELGTFEYVSAVFIALYVGLVIALMWSFLVSLYFSASTVIYGLLRRDVDGTGLDEVHDGEVGPEGSISPSPPSSSSGGISLPIANG